MNTTFSSSAARSLALIAAAGFSAACSDEALLLDARSGQGAIETTPEAGSAGSSEDSTGPEPAPTSDAGSGAGGAGIGGAGTGGAGTGGAGTGGADAGVPASGDGWLPPSPLFNRVGLDDAALARQALELMGSSAVGASGSCSGCHTLGRPTLTEWQQLTKSFADDCLADPALPDTAAVDAMYACFERRGDAGNLRTRNFGIFSAASHLDWFSFIFEHATATQADPEGLARTFVERAGMPRAGQRWTQDEFDIVAEWFTRGTPSLFELVPEDSGQGCQARLAPELISHVTDMATLGWRARAAELSLLMFGCAAGQAGAECLQDFPVARSEEYGTGWDVLDGTSIRILWDNTASPTHFWSRSSPDGRYIASGLVRQNASNYFGQFVDLERGVVIDANFSYDPTFFPDGSGFMVQRGATADVGGIAVTCEMSVLSADPASLSGQEPECSSVESEIGLYEQLARSLSGDDYWVLYGSYGDDEGGFRPVLDNPPAAFATASTTLLRPMINQGGSFLAGTPVALPTPLQGDPVLSPSGRLLITRVKGPEQTRTIDGSSVVTAEQSGYSIHLITTDDTGGTWTASASDVGQLCLTGGKPVLSFDERWAVLHHYVTAADATELGFTGETDPAFAAYRELGASNLYLVDLTNGDARRITNMRAGQYALYPHFRADNWIYFVVRTTDMQEYFAASDAALLSE